MLCAYSRPWVANRSVQVFIETDVDEIAGPEEVPFVVLDDSHVERLARDTRYRCATWYVTPDPRPCGWLQTEVEVHRASLGDTRAKLDIGPDSSAVQLVDIGATHGRRFILLGNRPGDWPTGSGRTAGRGDYGLEKALFELSLLSLFVTPPPSVSSATVPSRSIWGAS